MSEALISRKDAKAQGLKFFFTGKPCARGHLAPRRVSYGVCLFCARENDAAWKAANPEKAKAWQKAWGKANADKLRLLSKMRYQLDKDKIKAKVAARYRENRAEVYEYIKSWKEANREKVRAYSRAWAEENKAFYRECTARRRASRKQATPAWLTPEQIAEMRALYVSAPKGYHVDHIVPLNGKFVSGLHVPWNLQLLPGPENLKKSSKFQC